MSSMLADLATYSEHVIPDTEATLKKYLDVKYEYLSYCLKLKEMDDEEAEVHQLNENLYRVESGNYEYRLMLRCRQASRQKFVKMRHDVMVKIELLDQKHVRDIAGHLTRYAEAMRDCQKACEEAMSKPANSQIEIDVSTLTLRESESKERRQSAEDTVDEAQEAVDLIDVQGSEAPTTNTTSDLLDLDNERSENDKSLINFDFE
ncbi:hypothetical protein WR25_05889 [Diploscapter pachys]|uniref:AH domain-containing protein n=1 Tax=Diploscapter pachys TaxID=2018661 RepID=A0A2A2KEN4_9BILA|nr:hypothetical protein WR25_05889 [Diploscapter pachys]